jgi:hypothetical protein
LIHDRPLNRFHHIDRLANLLTWHSRRNSGLELQMMIGDDNTAGETPSRRKAKKS